MSRDWDAETEKLFMEYHKELFAPSSRDIERREARETIKALEDEVALLKDELKDSISPRELEDIIADVGYVR